MIMHNDNMSSRLLGGLAVSLSLVAGMTACTTDEPTPEDSFVFAEDGPAAYTRVDRTGMPALGAVVILNPQAYNEADPADDQAGAFVSEITDSVTMLHAALDDDLVAAGYTACLPADCVNQAAPLVVPDTIKMDLSSPAGFPNGRLLTDPVIDVTLAVVLLDLSVEGQDATSLVGLNPSENDVPFEAAFPYLAPYYSE
jgi:Domain of unknown function (DUF4331)